MLDTALKLSDSRLMLFGAIAIDTVCMGTLVVLLTLPGGASMLPASLLLVSLAITGPVLALTVGVSTLLISSKIAGEERARRAILAGTALHLGTQASLLAGMLCDCGGPTSLRAYVFSSTLWAVGLLAVLVPSVLLLRRHEKLEKREVPENP